jgi:MFS family permease
MSEPSRSPEKGSPSQAGLFADTTSGAPANEPATATPSSEPATWGRVRLPRTFAALQHQNFRLFVFGQLVSLVGMWMQNTAQGWLVVLLAAPAGATLAQAAAAAAWAAAEARANQYLSLIATAGALPVLLGSFVGGMIADRYAKRRVVVLTQTCAMTLAFGMSALVFGGHVQVWHVVVAATFSGIINAFDVPSRQAFVVEMVGKRDLGNAIALNSGIFNAARAVGPAAAGLLIGALASRFGEASALAQCFFWNGVSFLAVIVSLLRMRGMGEAPTASGHPPASPRQQAARWCVICANAGRPCCSSCSWRPRPCSWCPSSFCCPRSPVSRYTPMRGRSDF